MRIHPPDRESRAGYRPTSQMQRPDGPGAPDFQDGPGAPDFEDDQHRSRITMDGRMEERHFMAVRKEGERKKIKEKGKR